MKCEKCGKEWSASVYQIHRNICKGTIVVIEEKKPKRSRKDPEVDIQRGLLKAELDRKGIKYHANAKYDYLLKLVNESKEAE